MRSENGRMGMCRDFPWYSRCCGQDMHYVITLRRIGNIGDPDLALADSGSDGPGRKPCINVKPGCYMIRRRVCGVNGRVAAGDHPSM